VSTKAPNGVQHYCWVCCSLDRLNRIQVRQFTAEPEENSSLGKSFEAEREARKTGDSLNDEAILQLQTILKFEKRQRSESESKLEQHFRTEINRQIKNCFEQFDRRLEESYHKSEEVCMCVLTTIAEQTNNVLEKETSRLWEALRTHNHDLMIGTAAQGGKKSVQALANNGCFTGKSPRIIQLNQREFTARPIENNPALTPSTRVSSQLSESSLMTPRVNQRLVMPPAKRHYVNYDWH